MIPSRVVAEDAAGLASSLGPLASRFAGRTVLVTGAVGFLGSYLVECLAWLNEHALATPSSIIALDRRAPVVGTRLGYLLGRSDVRFLSQSVTDPLSLERADLVIHAASPASPRDYLSRPLATIDANVVGTRNLLELSRRGVESFLFVSSGEIYGEVDSAHTPTPESYPGLVSSIGERACYAESKRLGETLSVTYWREFGVPAKIVRPFHVYGPRQKLDDGRVMADLLRSRLAGTPLEVLSDGSDRRAFCYAADASDGFLRVLLSSSNGEAFNIGNEDEVVSIGQLAEIVAGLSEPRLPVRLAVDRAASHLAGTPHLACPDTRKARSSLGYRPSIPLRSGLRRTLAWHAEQAGAP